MKTAFRFRSSLFVLGALLGAGALISPVLSPVHAQNAPVATVGVVDEDKLADGYEKYKAAVDALDKRAQELDQKMPAREFLSEEEGKNFDAIVAKDKLTPAETTQLAGLVKSGMDKRAEYMSLIGKVNRTDADNNRMKTLQDTMSKNSGALREISEKLLAAIRALQDATDKEYIDRADSVVAQVAGDKKLLMVVRKRAILWSAGSVDITNDVLKRLNAS